MMACGRPGGSSGRPCVCAYHQGHSDSRRSSCCRAGFTVNGRPPSSLPLSPAIAACPAVLSGMSMKPKPRECPVLRSTTTWARPTIP